MTSELYLNACPLGSTIYFHFFSDGNTPFWNNYYTVANRLKNINHFEDTASFSTLHNYFIYPLNMFSA